jgi:hypothetical protein
MNFERKIKRKIDISKHYLEHSFYLRDDIKVILRLPIDFNIDEAFRIGQIVQGYAYAEDCLDDELQHYQFPVREGISVTLELPLDLSPQEASRFNEFLSSLPFC